MNEPAKQPDNLPAAPAVIGERQSSLIEKMFATEDFDKVVERCNYIAKSDFVPAGFKGNGPNVLMAIETGRGIGLSPPASLQYIAMVNNRPTLWGDGLAAIVYANGGDIKAQEIGGEGSDDWGYRVTVTRPGCDPETETFTVADAKKAKLWGKTGPWTQYPKKMLMYRARAFAVRQQFSDVLAGVHVREEVEDFIDVTPYNGDQSALQGNERRPSSRSESVLSSLGGTTESPDSAPTPSVDHNAEDSPSPSASAESGDLISESGASENASPPSSTATANDGVDSPAALGVQFDEASTIKEVMELRKYVAVNRAAFSDEEYKRLCERDKAAEERVRSGA